MDPSVAAKPWRESGDHEIFEVKKVPPKGFPVQLDSPLAWSGRQIQDANSFTYTLKEAEKEEINSALGFFLTLGLDGSEVNTSNFPLPTLGIQLRKLTKELHQGRGFFVLRGVDRSRYSVEDNAVIYLGVSSYIGATKGTQNNGRLLFTHIRQAKMTDPSQDNRPLRYSNRHLYFHNDIFCDILSMQAVSTPSSGGDVLLASAGIIYNELAVTRPDILEALVRPNWAPEGSGRFYEGQRRPILYFHNGQLILTLHVPPLQDTAGAKQSDGLPTATKQKQLEAFNVIQALATKHQVSLFMEPGDMIFINNFALLHSREMFHDSPKKHRYMLRSYFRNEELAWKLPRPLELINRTFYDDEERIFNVAP